MPISTIGQNGLNAPLSLTSPNLGTPSAINLSNATALAKAALPTGSVLQVVTNTYATQVSTTSSSAQTSGLSASITPSKTSNKIFVMIADPVRKSGTSITGIQLYIYRNGSNIFQPMTNQFYSGPSTADASGLASFWYLDSPSSTSSVTYTLYFASNGGSGTAYAQIDNNNGYITLMEIAA